jgi:hypothetical protein
MGQEKSGMLVTSLGLTAPIAKYNDINLLLLGVTSDEVAVHGSRAGNFGDTQRVLEYDKDVAFQQLKD